MKLPLQNSSLFFEIDDEDYILLLKHSDKFFLNNNGGIKLNSKVLKRTISIGSIIKGINSDHINRFKLDCRKSNLRISTQEQNSHNKTKFKNNTSGYKGVSFDKNRNKWHVQIRNKNKAIDLGRFTDKILAAIAYDDAAIELHGEFACLNFPLYGA